MLIKFPSLFFSGLYLKLTTWNWSIAPDSLTIRKLACDILTNGQIYFWGIAIWNYVWPSVDLLWSLKVRFGGGIRKLTCAFLFLAFSWRHEWNVNNDTGHIVGQSTLCVFIGDTSYTMYICAWAVNTLPSFSTTIQQCKGGRSVIHDTKCHEHSWTFCRHFTGE